jgi:GntP family gluconate:H+ symporter
VAGLLGVDLGVMFLVGIPFILVLIPVVLTYARIMGKRLEPFRDHTMFADEEAEADTRPVISAGRAAIPLIVPIVLIIGNTVTKALIPDSPVQAVAGFLGAPAIALLIGLIIGAYLLPQRRTDRKTVVAWLGQAAASGGLIIFITGAGGSFANVLTQSGVGKNLADGVGMLPLPLFLIPFVIASVVRVAQGSGTVAMITAATLAVPLVQDGGLNPVLAAMAAACGAFVFSQFNDSFFWVVTKFAGLSGVNAMKAWSGMTTTIWAATIPLLFILWAIVG